MKFLHTFLTVSGIGMLIPVSGCGAPQVIKHPANANVTNSTNVVTSVSSKPLIWIEYARYTAYQEHQGPTYWVLTNKHVRDVGESLGAIDPSPLNSSGWHSNVLRVGTKFFVIPGLPSTKEFAVKMKNGNYLEAVLAGAKKPS